MSKELTTIPAQHLEQTPEISDGNMMLVIARAAADPNMNVEKMERLLAMQERWENRKAEREFNEAMALAQAEMPMILKTSKNPHTGSDYAKLEAVKIAMSPVIAKHGFSLIFSEGKSDHPEKIRVLCDVNHGGHTIQRYLDLSRDDVGAQGKASKTKIQGEGSTFSYGVRYLTTMIFNVIVAGMDNDGNKSNRPKPTGPAVVIADDAKKIEELKNRLWNLLKPVVSQNVDWDKTNWDAHNQFLWKHEILDAAANEAAPKLSVKKFDETITKTTAKLKELQ